MSWIYLLFAILFEVTGTTCMKLSEGFTRRLPSVLLFLFYGVSFTFMTLAVKRIEISVVYAIWSGLGTAIIAVIGMLVFEEKMTFMKVVWLALIVVGVIGLNVTSEVPLQE